MNSHLRPLLADDIAAIAHWPPYPAAFSELDYALRKDGWFAEFSRREEARLYAFEQAGELVAFSLLAATARGEAEFRIALHPDRLGSGLGRDVTAQTLERGFGELGLTRIHLIVRKTNPRALGLYQRLGFVLCGECCEMVNGEMTTFWRMDIQDGKAA